MANENTETFGQTILRGMAWGLGFAVVSVPVGMVIHAIFDDDKKDPYGLTPEEKIMLLQHRANTDLAEED